jgi:hypothetical protein
MAETIKQPDNPKDAGESQSTSTITPIANVMEQLLHPNKSRPPKWDIEKWYRIRNRSSETLNLISTTKDVVAIIYSDTARVLSGKELQEVDEDFIDHLEVAGTINIRELDYQQGKDYSIINLTSKRVSIRHNAFQDREFFIPAFGSRDVNGKTLLELDYLAWESQGLIEIHPLVNEVQSSGAEAITGLIVVLLGFFWLLGIPLALFGSIGWGIVGTGTLLGFAAIAVSLLFTSRNNQDFFNDLGNWLKLLPGIALVLGIGIGLPVGIIYFYGDGQQLLTETHRFELATLGRLLQTGFISIASMLPAFLFYLFGRQQVAKQRENFYREAMILDPNVWSNSEAKNKYGPLLNSVYDTGNSPFSILLLIVSTALLVNGWIIALTPIGPVPATITNLADFFTPNGSPFAFGFLGVYFFTINMIYRRYVRADLTPKTYAYITVRLLFTVVLVWAVSTLPQFSTGSYLEKGLSIVAFMIGIFPESGLTLLQDYFNKITTKRRGQDPDIFSLTKLEGMNLYDQARLMEEGIENIENLAHHNLMELIARTRIPTQRLVDMFDQAILYLHLGTEENKIRKLLKSLGVRTATDLLNCRNKLDDFQDEEANKDLVKKLNVIIASLDDDEWLTYIDSWHKYSLREKEPPISNPYKFYYRAIGIETDSTNASVEAPKDKPKTDPDKKVLPPPPAEVLVLPVDTKNENPVN